MAQSFTSLPELGSSTAAPQPRARRPVIGKQRVIKRPQSAAVHLTSNEAAMAAMNKEKGMRPNAKRPMSAGTSRSMATKDLGSECASSKPRPSSAAVSRHSTERTTSMFGESSCWGAPSLMSRGAPGGNAVQLRNIAHQFEAQTAIHQQTAEELQEGVERELEEELSDLSGRLIGEVMRKDAVQRREREVMEEYTQMTEVTQPSRAKIFGRQEEERQAAIRAHEEDEQKLNCEIVDLEQRLSELVAEAGIEDSEMDEVQKRHMQSVRELRMYHQHKVEDIACDCDALVEETDTSLRLLQEELARPPTGVYHSREVELLDAEIAQEEAKLAQELGSIEELQTELGRLRGLELLYYDTRERNEDLEELLGRYMREIS